MEGEEHRGLTAHHGAAPGGACFLRTVPLLPSTTSVVPVLILVKASAMPSTAGMPNSRATMAACESIPPVSLISNRGLEVERY